MSTRQQYRAQRRKRLVAQALQQRLVLVESIEELRSPLKLVDQGVSVLCYLRAHPEWIAGLTLAVATFRLGRAGVWLGRGWVAWQALQKLRGSWLSLARKTEV